MRYDVGWFAESTYECVVMGDPHGYSFDGLKNDFMGACTHVWLQNNCVDGAADGDPTWLVATRNSRNGRTKRVSWVNAVVVEYRGTVGWA